MRNIFYTFLFACGILLQANAMNTSEERLKSTIRQCFAEADIDISDTKDSSLMGMLEPIMHGRHKESDQRDKCARVAENILNRMLDGNMLDDSTADVIPWLIDPLYDDARKTMTQKALTSFLNSPDQVLLSNIYKIYQVIRVGMSDFDTEAAQNTACAVLERLLKASELTILKASELTILKTPELAILKAPELRMWQLEGMIALLDFLDEGARQTIAPKLFDRLLVAPVCERPSIDFLYRAGVISSYVSPNTIGYFEELLKKGFTAEPQLYDDRDFLNAFTKIIQETSCGRWTGGKWLPRDLKCKLASCELIKYMMESVIPDWPSERRGQAFLFISQFAPQELLPEFLQAWCNMARHTLFEGVTIWSSRTADEQCILNENGLLALDTLLMSQRGLFSLEEAESLIDFIPYTDLEDFVKSIDFGDDKQRGIDELIECISDPGRAEFVRGCFGESMRR